MHDLELELDQIPFSKIKYLLADAITNYKNGLKIIREALIESVIKRAELITQLKSKSGRSFSTEQVIYNFYQEIVSTSYLTAERFNTDATMLVKTSIQPELYHWLLEIPEYFGVKKTIVLQEGIRFITETFDQKILNPLKPLIELAKRPDIEGSLAQLKPIDLTKSNPIGDGYVISCVRGEAQNPVLWPVLYHEIFELIDAEQNLLQNLEDFVTKKKRNLPILDSDSKTNKHWTLEIFMDFLAINSFGPMYAKSLLEYFKRSPYYQTLQHPEMSSRLFCVYQYLTSSFNSEMDIFYKCQTKARQEIEPEITRYEAEQELDSAKKQKLSSLYSLMVQFLGTIDIPTFLNRLEEYRQQSTNSQATFNNLLKDERKFIPFQDPLFNFEDIRNNILYHHISLAIDPCVMLNVVLANNDLYQMKEHLPVVIDSIRKWKIKQVWNLSVDELSRES